MRLGKLRANLGVAPRRKISACSGYQLLVVQTVASHNIKTSRLICTGAWIKASRILNLDTRWIQW